MGSKIQLKQEEEQIQSNPYREDYRRRKGMEPRKKKLLQLLIAAAAVYIIYVIVPLPVANSLDYIFTIRMSPAQYADELRSSVQSLGIILSGQDLSDTLGYTEWLSVEEKLRDILWGICALAVGAGLSVTGAVFQGSFRNSIASPTTLGVMSGGTLGSTIYIMWGSAWFGGGIGNQLSEFTGMSSLGAGKFLFVLIGCFGAVLFTGGVAKLASRGGRISMVTLIVVGMVFSTAVSTVSQYIQMYVNTTDPYGSKAAQLQTAMAGRMSEGAVWIVVVVVAAVVTFLILSAKRLNLIVFGEDEARAMGINVSRTRNIMMALCTVMTAVIIAACGGIGFVGLIIPHITRRVVGSDFRYLLPGCVMIGGIFVLICQWIPPISWMSSAHVSDYTSIVGGAVFLFMIIRNRRQSHADWA
ncbi:MAG: iron ABC transporter permease [Clostridiales bacterium]|nr:iron ABC transporter permease [Clostridiales bacterium]